MNKNYIDKKIKEKIIYKKNMLEDITMNTNLKYLLFKILFNKYFLLNTKYLIDIQVFYKNKYITDQVSTVEEYRAVKEKILLKYPYYLNDTYKTINSKIYFIQNDIINYISISDKFIYNIFLLNKYLSNIKIIRYIDL
jgi:hypothetical protein